VLGGGVGAITAAFALTRPELEKRYEVTVYQLGWRLGGKGASGRGEHGRIEEHGLHIWFGFYENAFRLMRECYGELARPAGIPLRSVEEAFQPASRFGVCERRLDRWITWTNVFPEHESAPGELDPRDREEPTIGRYIVQLLGLAEAALRSVLDQRPRRPRVHAVAPARRPAGSVRAVARPRPRSATDVVRAASRVVDQVADVVDDLELGALVAAIELARTIDDTLDWLGPSGDTLIGLVDGFVDDLSDRLAAELEETEEGRRALELIDLVTTAARGLVRDGVVRHPAGLHALDHFDLREWFQLHGARRISTEGGLLRGIYDLVFAYRDGDPSRPAFAAGQGLRGMFRMFFDYRGSFAYRMQAGMGDVVFGPYYEVLRNRGVRFEFFHRVTDLVPSADGRRIDGVRIDRQARLKSGSEYEPLVPVGGLPCWPAHPDWDQIAEPTVPDGAARPDLESDWNQPPPVESVELRAGVDFDHVVFGLSLGSVPAVCPQLLAQKPQWQAMVDQVATVSTQALQIWLTPTTADVGGDAHAPVIAGYVEPFDTWADMSELVSAEAWPAGAEPGSIHYFCNVLPELPLRPGDDPNELPARALQQVRDNARRFLDRDVGQFLPGAVDAYPQEFRWDLLAGDSTRTGADRLESQYLRANIASSERYVQSLPGTDRYRLAPGESGYQNLALAGDWTDTGFNAGCVEAATMSGLLAAQAVIGSSDTHHVVGHRHP
jgi:uncharacterized protein with NAD-binding domain and iron-sulfur cluster